MAKATRTAPAAASTEAAPLSRGQKAAQTRRLNAAAKAAAHAKKVKTVKVATAAKVPTAKDRAANLKRLVREQKARDKLKAKLKAEREAHTAEKRADKAATDKRIKNVRSIRGVGAKAIDTGTLGILRHNAVLTATRGKRTSYEYAAALNSAFPGWHTFKRSDAKKDTNHGLMVIAFFEEQKVFYADMRANFDGVGDCNPSATWANIKKYGLNLLVDGIAKPRGGAARIDLDKVAIRDLEKLYLRINNQKEEDFNANPKLAEASKQVLGVLAFLGANVGVINSKIAPKK